MRGLPSAKIARPQHSVYIILAIVSSPKPKTAYESFWRNLYKGHQDFVSAFEPYYDKKVDGITPIRFPELSGIDWTKLIPPKPELTESDRVRCGIDYVRRAGGLRNILGDRSIMRDITPDDVIRYPMHNLTLEELMRPLGTRTISEQYLYDRERPQWEGILGHTLDQGPPGLSVAGALGDQTLRKGPDMNLREACALHLINSRTQKSATSPQMSVGFGALPPKPATPDPTFTDLLPPKGVPNMRELEAMSLLVRPV